MSFGLKSLSWNKLSEGAKSDPELLYIHHAVASSNIYLLLLFMCLFKEKKLPNVA